MLHFCPYRNDHIIKIVQDMYFSGGSRLFAMRFDRHFPRFEERNGMISHEVPIPMIALVATAVSSNIYSILLHPSTIITII